MKSIMIVMMLVVLLLVVVVVGGGGLVSVVLGCFRVMTTIYTTGGLLRSLLRSMSRASGWSRTV